MMKQVYLILAALMLLCLAPMPYGYFQLVRFVAMVVFGIMAYRYYVADKTIAATVFGVLALLFQPIYKIALGRTVWNVVDVVVAVLLNPMLNSINEKCARIRAAFVGQFDDYIYGRISAQAL